MTHQNATPRACASPATIQLVKRHRIEAAASIDVLRLKLARLRAQRAAENFESKLRLFARTLQQRYSPDQPRIPPGSREGGRWTSGGGGRGNPGDQTALNVDPNAVSAPGGLVEPAQQIDLVDLHYEEGATTRGTLFVTMSVRAKRI
jgi:hypothetical protein